MLQREIAAGVIYDPDDDDDGGGQGLVVGGVGVSKNFHVIKTTDFHFGKKNSI